MQNLSPQKNKGLKSIFIGVIVFIFSFIIKFPLYIFSIIFIIYGFFQIVQKNTENGAKDDHRAFKKTLLVLFLAALGWVSYIIYGMSKLYD